MDKGYNGFDLEVNNTILSILMSRGALLIWDFGVLLLTFSRCWV